MKNVHNVISTIGLFVIVAVACSKKESVNTQIPISYQAIKTAFGDNINMNNIIRDKYYDDDHKNDDDNDNHDHDDDVNNDDIDDDSSPIS